MKIGAISNTYNSINFGRAPVSADEAKQAFEASKLAREAMGFSQGKGILMLPSDKLPGADVDTNVMDKVKQFFQGVKNLLGINGVEVVGESPLNVDDILKEEGIKKFSLFDFKGKQDELKELEKAVKTAAAKADGLRIVDAQKYSEEQLDLIEKVIKEVKGEDFDLKSIIYDVNNGDVFDWGSTSIAQKFKGRTIMGSSNYLNDNGGELWGSTSFFTDRMKAPQGDFIHGIRRFGEPALSTQMFDKGQVDQSINLLETELKLQNEDILEPVRWAAAKRADVTMSENFYKHFDDLIPGMKAGVVDFEQIYQSALQEGKGDNYFDSLAKAMKAKGLDETHADLYEQIVKFRNALFAQGPKTMQEAASLSAEQIEASYKNLENPVLQGFNVKEAARKAQEAVLQHKKDLEQKAQNMNPINSGLFDKAIDFSRKNKNSLFAAAGVALLALVGATMFSYGKETAQKVKKATPANEPRLNQKA